MVQWKRESSYSTYNVDDTIRMDQGGRNQENQQLFEIQEIHVRRLLFAFRETMNKEKRLIKLGEMNTFTQVMGNSKHALHILYLTA